MGNYYNSSYGAGIEGFMNWANISVNGWLASGFLAMIWIIFVYVGSKSEWKMSGVVSYASLVVLLSAMVIQLFTIVNEIVIFASIFTLGVGVLWGIIEGR